MQKSSFNFNLGLFLFLFLIITGCSCNNQPIDVPESNDFTKADREKLGLILYNQLQNHSSDFPILENIGENTIAYHFIQTLYNQATNIIRLDLDAPSSNRWNIDREWEIIILDKAEEKIAFTLPGGFFFVSTGFLKSMEKENELFYLLAFEATLMHSQYLLNRFISEYNSVNLKSIIDGSSNSNGITPERIALDLPEMIFAPTVTLKIDELAVKMICETSLYKPDGIIDILNDISFAENVWLKKRETYNNRDTKVVEMINNNEEDCGELRTNGAYQERVLNILD